MPMRLIVGISLLLLGVGMLFSQVEVLSAPSASDSVSTPWVRTVDGWERHGSWSVSSVGPPAVHPLVVAAGQVLGSILALVAFQRDGQVDRRNR
jgi:hypothetical protein